MAKRLARISSCMVAAALACVLVAPDQLTYAQDQSTKSQQQQIETEKSAAKDAAQKVKKFGPTQIALRDQGTLALPGGMEFVGQPEAGRLLQAFGEPNGPSLLGILAPSDRGANWWATVEFIPAGYVKDDDAKTWNTDELLRNIQEATLADNAERKSRGYPDVEVTGWYEAPRYDASTRRLVWSAIVREKNGAADDAGTVNYNTYALGRDGYFSLDLIAPPETLNTAKAVAGTLLSDLSYNSGKGYDDFNASTDHIAEYGLAALVGGVALKKLGLFALGAAFVLKFAKVILVAVAAAAMALRRLVFRKSKGKTEA